jgi:hypothetical protein
MNNVKDAKKIISYAFYSQIWLNYLIGWLPLQLHHKNEEINTVCQAFCLSSSFVQPFF